MFFLPVFNIKSFYDLYGWYNRKLFDQNFKSGIYNPAEPACKLKPDPNNPDIQIYDSLNNDYPSLSQIENALSREEKYLIIGTKIYLRQFYSSLTENNFLTAWISTFDAKNGGSSGLQNMILSLYSEIKDDLAIKVQNIDSSVNVTLRFDNDANQCASKGPENLKEIVCKKAGVNEDIGFIADIMINEKMCNKGTQSFTIKVFGQTNSEMSVTVTPDCICDCMSSVEPDSKMCNGKGDLQCGTCSCYKGFYGDRCECTKDDSELDLGQISSENLKKCTQPGTQEVCNNHGYCRCGKCSCTGVNFGKFCECSQEDCNCGQNGRCEECKDGKPVCKCNNGWTLGPKSNKCDCPQKTDNCMDPFTKLNCNNKGKCMCNKCECESGSSGAYCQQPVSGKLVDISNTCNTIAPCVTLKVFEHILKKEDPSQLSRYVEKCKETKLVEQDRLECYYHVQNGSYDQSNSAELGLTPNCTRVPTLEPVDLIKCTASFKECPFTFYHDAQDGAYAYTSTNMGKIKAYVDYMSKDENEATNYNGNIDLDYKMTVVTCPYAIEKSIVIASAGGSAILLFLSFFLAYFIIINVRERRQYYAFKKRVEHIFDDGNVYVNKLPTPPSRAERMSRYLRNRMSVVTKVIGSPSS